MVEQVKKFLKEHPNAVIQFHRPSCPFCVYVAPLYKAAQEKYADHVAFLLVDITHDAKNLKNEFGFSTVPEFQYYKDGIKSHAHGSKSRTLKLSDIEALIQELYL